MPAFNLFTQPPEPNPSAGQTTTNQQIFNQYLDQKESLRGLLYQADQMTAIREYFDLTVINWDRLSPYARQELIHAYYNDHSHRCQQTRMRMGI